MILSFSDIMPNRSYPPAEGFGPFIRMAICLEADSKVKPEATKGSVVTLRAVDQEGNELRTGTGFFVGDGNKSRYKFSRD